MENTIVIKYDAPLDDDVFVRKMERVFEKYPDDWSTLILFENEFLANFKKYITYEQVRFRNILFINARGKGSIRIKDQIKGQYISSDMDWILSMILVFVVFITLISILDYYFYSKRRYDITYKMMFY